MRSSLEQFYLYENALINAIRSEYENGPESATNKQAWAKVRTLRADLVLAIKQE